MTRIVSLNYVLWATYFEPGVLNTYELWILYFEYELLIQFNIVIYMLIQFMYYSFYACVSVCEIITLPFGKIYQSRCDLSTAYISYFKSRV